MKKICSKLTAAILCIVMCFALAGCNADLKTILLVKESYDAIMKVNSFDFSASADASATAWTEDLNFTVKAEGSYIVAPASGEIRGEVDLGEQGKYSAPIYIQEKNNALEAYIGLALGSVTIWFKDSVDMADNAFAGDVESFVEYLKSVAKPKLLKDEKEINGSTAKALSLTIPGEVFMQTDEAGAIIKGEHPVGELSLVMWIDKKTSLPLRLEGDMGEIVQYYLDLMGENAEENISVNSIPVTVDLSNYNGVYSIKQPSETANAIDLSDYIAEKAALFGGAVQATEDTEPETSPAPTATAKPKAGSALPEGASVWGRG